jgi:undecaprenyl-diphosphatase
MTVIMSIFLGLVQGVTEFLPISSSGHLSILQNLFSINYTEDEHLLFTMFLHMGTLISIIFVYKKEIQAMISDSLGFLRMRSESDSEEPVVMKPPARALLFVLVGTAPMLIALIFMKSISRLFFSVGFIGFALLITGGLLYASDKFIAKGNKTEKTMTLGDALIIGLAQAVAVLPGLSRSGTTISVGLARGLSGSFAVRFSLLLSIPAVFGATLVSLFNAIRGGINFALLPAYLIGFIVATVVGFFAIQLIRRLISKGLGKFAYYCWGVGALALIMSLIIRN